MENIIENQSGTSTFDCGKKSRYALLKMSRLVIDDRQARCGILNLFLARKSSSLAPARHFFYPEARSYLY